MGSRARLLTARRSYQPEVLGVLGAGLLGAVFALGADKVGPLVTGGALLAPVVAIVVFARPMLGIYVAVLAVPLEFATTRFGSSFSLSPTKSLLLLTGACVGVRLIASGPRHGIHRAHLAFAGLLGVMALGIAAAASPVSTEKILTVWTGVWLASVAVASADRDQVRRVMVCIAFSGAMLGLIALLGAGPQALQGGGAVATNRATGSFTHPNQLGGYMVLALPVTIVLVSEIRGWLRIALLAAVAVEIAGLSLTLARGAILGGAAASVVLLAWPGYRRVVLAGLAVLMVVIVVNPGLVQTHETQTIVTRLKTVGKFRETSGGRIRLWRATPRIIADHPLIGIGAGNFPTVSPDYGVLDAGAVPFDHAHDVPLTIAVETGLVGLALFVWFGVSVARAGLSALRRSDRTGFKLALALLAAYVGMAVVSVTDDLLTETADFALVMIEGALLIALDRAAVAPAHRRQHGLDAIAPEL